MSVGSLIRSSARVRSFTYAIRNIVAEAKKVEAGGRKVRYLNIGDPVAFGFQTPAHLVEAATGAMRSGHNGYLRSFGFGLRGGDCHRSGRFERLGGPVVLFGSELVCSCFFSR